MSETPAPSSTAADGAPAVEAPPLAPDGAPLCYVVDEEPSIRHFLSLVLHGSGVDTVEFADGVSMRKAVEARPPALIFHNISLESADAIESVVALGKLKYRGAVQLMSGRGAAVLEHVKGIGAQHKLQMLPALKKPFETETIVKIIQELKLGMPPAVAARLELDDAIKNNWIEFWYQPKIALRKKQLAGAEAYARVRHPQHGIVLAAAFTANASETATATLAEISLESALKTGGHFSKLGVNLRLSVNIPVPALVKIPVEDIVKAHHAANDKWPGLVIDVPEDQIVNDLKLASELSKKFEPYNVRLAIDNFGRAYSALAKTEELPFEELKLDRSFVADCGTDKVNAPLCKTVIDLAHNFGRYVVAVGIEKAADASALVSMGCDYGQGFLLGQPMPEERFVSLLRQRAATQGRNLDAAKAQTEKHPA
ncbi:MAG TPA: EAL domain-containing response regulator [Pseudolabrys sp.]|nr:EAL domain-containing response regulator [Pseudolabrys sp.]